MRLSALTSARSALRMAPRVELYTAYVALLRWGGPQGARGAQGAHVVGYYTVLSLGLTGTSY